MVLNIKGACNWCGLCGCYDTGEQNLEFNWFPAIRNYLFDWYRQHPESSEPLITLIKKEINWVRGMSNIFGEVVILDVGLIKFYLSEKGLQVSPTDRSCPFFDKQTHRCKLWNSTYLLSICKNSPQQNIKKEKEINQWSKDHPECGFYWEGE